MTKQQQENLKRSVCDIDISVRLANALQEHLRVFTVHDLLMKKPEQILAVPNVGSRSLEKIYIALEKIGFYRKSKVT